MDSSCPVCIIKVLDSEDGIGCDGHCKRWFHIRCVRMSKTEYSMYANDNNKKWHCNRTDCLRTNDQPINKLIAQMSDLSSKMSTLITAIDSIKTVSSDVADIKKDVKALNDKLESFDPRLIASETRIAALEDRVSDLDARSGNVAAGGPEEIIREMNERSKCLSNIILYGLPESNSKDTNIKKNFDVTKVTTLLSTGCPEVSAEGMKMFRLGAPSRNRNGPRPLKVIFKKEADARKVVESFDLNAVKQLDAFYSNVTLSRDRTKRERNHLSSLREELQARTSAGEGNLTIKYVHGVPAIVKANTKN